MIIFGTGSGKIANFEIKADKCGYCEIDTPQEITVFGRYFDVFWIPVFPIGKKAVAECTHCKKTISQRDFPPKLKEAYQKHKLKTPLKHWFLSLLVGVPIVILVSISIISAIFGLENEATKNDSEKDYKSDFYETEPLKRSDYISEKENIIFRDLAPKLSGEVQMRYTESYGSKCCPRDLKHDNNIFSYVKEFKNKHKIKIIEAFVVSTGKEGEFTVYFTLNELTPSQKKEFIQNRSLIFLEDTREEYLKESRYIMENPIELSKKQVEKLKKVAL